MNYETTSEIEIAVAKFFDTRKYVIVPNINGMFIHELDLCILNIISLYATEVEIKISKSDLKADAKKKHHHKTTFIKYLWFAMPERMNDCEEFIPEGAGLLLVSKTGIVKVVKKPVANKDARKWDYERSFKLARLGTLRMWNLKKDIRECRNQYNLLKEKLDKYEQT